MPVSVWLCLLEQTVSSWCLLRSGGLCAGLPQRGGRRLLATSVVCGLLATIGVALPTIMRVLMLLLIVTAGPVAAWPGVPRRMLLRLTGVTALLTVLMAGLMRFLSGLHPYSGRGSVAAAMTLLACIALTRLAVPLRRVRDVPRCASVRIRKGGQRLTLTALIDSGNLLRDAVTGLPVIVISRRSASKLVLLPPDGSLLPGMRLMLVRTISGAAMMTVFRADGVQLLHQGAWQDTQALIGLSPDGYDGFQALVPACLMEDAAPCDRRIISQGG